MKRMVKLMAVFFALIAPFVQLPIAESQMTVFPSLMNSGFEEAEQGKPKYWRFVGPDDALIWDGSIYKEGKHSAQIVLPQHSKEGMRLEQALEAEAFKRYDIGGAIKTENLEDGFAQIKVIFLDKNRNEIKGFDVLKLSGSQDWNLKVVLVESPLGSDVAYIICSVNGKGKAWFDDIRFTTKIGGGY